VVKTNLSLDIGKTLNDDTLSDDQKVKRSLQTEQILSGDRHSPIASTSKSNPLTVVAAQTKKKKKKRRSTWLPY